jgi:catechol 2,3-dioxygenase-like lactoylglutathione lyase family enzyme
MPATSTPSPSPTPVSTLPPATATTSSPPTTVAGAFFALSVADVEASAQWYTEKLDLQIVLQPPKTNDAKTIVLEGNGLIVELIQYTGARPLKQVAPELDNNILVHGIFKVGVIVEDFDKTLALLKARNVPIVVGPFPARANQRANVIIRDNEGNLIQFFGR